MILILAGVSGSGKTTAGILIARRLHWRFADADEFHPAANIRKMRSGIPLTDADRQPWLHAVGAWMDARIADGESAVLACSALKRSYRDTLLRGRPAARMAFLTVGGDALARRLTARRGHFFPGRLLGSQFDALELPRPDEHAVTVVAETGDAASTAAAVLAVMFSGEDVPPGAPGAAGGEHEAET